MWIGHPAWPGVPNRPAKGGAGLGGMTRRALVRAGGGGAVAAFWASLPPAIAASVGAAVEEVLAGRAFVESSRLRIDLPEHFDYGTSVPLAVTVESPMTEADHVRRVSVFAAGNPFPEVASIHFTPANGRPSV